MVSKRTKDILLFSAICVLCAITVVVIYYVNQNTKLEETNVIDFLEIEETCHLSQFQGDGICDDEVNTAECFFDIGDCCSTESDKSLCTHCLCQAPENNYTLIGNCTEDQRDDWLSIGNR